MVSTALTMNHLVSLLVPLWMGHYRQPRLKWIWVFNSVPLHVQSMTLGKLNHIYEMWMIISTAQWCLCVCNGKMWARQLVHSLSQFCWLCCSFVCWAILFLSFFLFFFFYLLSTAGKPSEFTWKKKRKVPCFKVLFLLWCASFWICFCP